MGCSFAGLFAIIIFGVAVLLNIISVSLPLWSTSTIVRDTQTNLQTSDFTAGLWGFCTDFQYSSEFSDDALSFDSCYMFHTSTENELIERDNALFRVTADFSVCGAYDEYGDSVRSTAIVEGLWLAAGLDRGQFQDFLGKSCDGVGNWTLTIGFISPIVGLVGFIVLILGVTCCSNQSGWIASGKWFAGLACLGSTVTFILWLVQEDPLDEEDEVGLGASFTMGVIAAVLYLVTALLVARHATFASS